VSGVNPRGRLLDAAIEHIAARGISDLSLRALARAIGTSHRMLIHHFGSREGLWVAVVRAVEERQRDALADLVLDPELPPAELMRAWWRHISDEVLWPNERLFFELYGQALQGRPGTTELLDGIIEAWLAPASTRRWTSTSACWRPPDASPDAPPQLASRLASWPRERTPSLA
jgi:AcrR family transcriptional regulator